jgi:hypothetical protein
MQSYLHSSAQVQCVSTSAGDDVVTTSGEGEHRLRQAERQARKGGLLSPYEAMAGATPRARPPRSKSSDHGKPDRGRARRLEVMARTRDGERGRREWPGAEAVARVKRTGADRPDC